MASLEREVVDLWVLGKRVRVPEPINDGPEGEDGARVSFCDEPSDDYLVFAQFTVNAFDIDDAQAELSDYILRCMKNHPHPAIGFWGMKDRVPCKE